MEKPSKRYWRSPAALSYGAAPAESVYLGRMAEAFDELLATCLFT